MLSRTISIIVMTSFLITGCAQNKKEDVKNEDAGTTISKAEIVLVTPEDLNKAGDEIILLDVRSPEEYAQGHIKHAKNVNYFDADFMDQILKLDKNEEIYLYCKGGKRSNNAANKLKQAGFTKIYDLKGGIVNWTNQGLDISK